MMQPAIPQPLSCPESVRAAPSPESGLAAAIPAYKSGVQAKVDQITDFWFLESVAGVTGTV